MKHGNNLLWIFLNLDDPQDFSAFFIYAFSIMDMNWILGSQTKLQWNFLGGVGAVEHRK